MTLTASQCRAALSAMFGAVILASAAQAAAQPQCLAPQGRLPELAENATRPIDLIPRGWKLYDKVDGDLNGDRLSDSVLVIQVNDPQGIIFNPDGLGYDYVDCNQRALLVVFQQGAGDFHVAASSDAIIPDWSSPTINDPYNGVEIANGALMLALEFWANAGSWETRSQKFRFRWNGEDMALIGYDDQSVHRGSGDVQQTSVNYLTGKRKDAKGSISDDQQNWVWSDVNKGSAPVLDTVGNGFEFTP